MQALTKLNPTDPVRFDSMNAILGEIEGRDDELAKQINVLEGLTNGFKMYKSISELGLSMGTPMKDIGKSMKDNSRLITYMRKADYPESPTNYGILEVVRASGNYISYTWKTSVSSVAQIAQMLYMAHYHTGLDLWTDWERIGTTEKVDIQFPYASGWNDFSATALSQQSFYQRDGAGTVTLILNAKSDLPIGERTLVGVLPVGFRPKADILIATGDTGDGKNMGIVSVFTNGNVLVAPVKSINPTIVRARVGVSFIAV